MLMEMFKNGKKQAEMDLDHLDNDQVFKILEIQIEVLGRHVTIDGVPIVGNTKSQ